jgi:3-phytase/alkaline phosphatase D
MSFRPVHPIHRQGCLPQTQQLRVTTYGIDSYTPTQVAADPDAILSRTPTVVNEFVVDPVGR